MPVNRHLVWIHVKHDDGRLFNYVAKGYVIIQKNIGKPNDINKLLSYGTFTIRIRTVKGANLTRGTRESSSRYVLNT